MGRNNGRSRKSKAAATKGPSTPRAVAPAQGAPRRETPAPSPAEDGPKDTSVQPRQSIAQRRAAHALKAIKALETGDEASSKTGVDVYGNYRAYVEALPATIILSGLGQAMAMERAGASKTSESVKLGHQYLYEHVSSWLCGGKGEPAGWVSSPYKQQTDGNLLAAIAEGDERAYVRAQMEAMEYLEWLKKFAMAFLVKLDAVEDDPS